MSNMAAKLKPMDVDLELKPPLLVHLVMASLPKEFDNFVINYNMSPDKWDIENMIAMCVQEEDRLKASNGGSIYYVKDNRKKNYHNSNQGSPSKLYGKGPQQYHQPTLPVSQRQEDWAFQERLPRLAQVNNGKERYRYSFFCK
jgi:hypothetical protein